MRELLSSQHSRTPAPFPASRPVGYGCDCVLPNHVDFRGFNTRGRHDVVSVLVDDSMTPERQSLVGLSTACLDGKSIADGMGWRIRILRWVDTLSAYIVISGCVNRRASSAQELRCTREKTLLLIDAGSCLLGCLRNE